MRACSPDAPCPSQAGPGLQPAPTRADNKRVRRTAFLVLVSTLSVLHVQAQVPAVGASPLHVATARGLTDIVETLLTNGANPDERDMLGRTPLHYATRYVDIARLLIEAGASVDAADRFGETPLHRAITNRAVVDLLLENGASVTTRNHVGNTPLDLALRLRLLPRTLDTIRVLIEAGAF